MGESECRQTKLEHYVYGDIQQNWQRKGENQFIRCEGLTILFEF